MTARSPGPGAWRMAMARGFSTGRVDRGPEPIRERRGPERGHTPPQNPLRCPRTRENVMVARNYAGSLAAIVSAAMLTPLAPAGAEDFLRIAVAQRGQWDTAVTELGQRSGILKKRGIAVEVLYTQGGPEAHQAVISGSMDIACGGCIESAIGGYSKGAPGAIIGRG